jgi:hypothetical protein
MSNITYETEISVALDGEHVGKIQSEEGGYRYFPLFDLKGGELFPTLDACKASLEDD